ncbi:hypothetical protein B0A48_03898 [Cryoendolithus antarcticus]|uniref:Uncharacterized protein n=1 Tax=Cryoendolithus antarcticus TaxID=1507870 RepID=A0A1V8TGW0_9PEZI|nr:hypothetical protein B0A48_03898 [Cryoendolithus antarcticus]
MVRGIRKIFSRDEQAAQIAAMIELVLNRPASEDTAAALRDLFRAIARLLQNQHFSGPEWDRIRRRVNEALIGLFADQVRQGIPNPVGRSAISVKSHYNSQRKSLLQGARVKNNLKRSKSPSPSSDDEETVEDGQPKKRQKGKASCDDKEKKVKGEPEDGDDDEGGSGGPGADNRACNEADQSSLEDYHLHFCSDQATASSSTVSPSALPSTYARVDAGDAQPAPDAADGSPADAGSANQTPAQAAQAATESDSTAPADVNSTSSGDVAPAATLPPPSSGSDSASATAPPQYTSGGDEGAAIVGNTSATTPDSLSNTSEATSTAAVPDTQTPTDLPGSITFPSDSASVTSVVVSDTSSIATPQESSSAEPELTTAETVSSSTSTLPTTESAVYPSTVPGSSGGKKRVEYSQTALAGLTVVLVAIVGWVGMQ